VLCTKLFRHFLPTLHLCIGLCYPELYLLFSYFVRPGGCNTVSDACACSHWYGIVIISAYSGPSRGWGGGKLPGPSRHLRGPTVGQKYEVRQNASFWKEKLLNFLPRGALYKCLGALQRCFPWPAVALDRPVHIKPLHFKSDCIIILFFDVCLCQTTCRSLNTCRTLKWFLLMHAVLFPSSG